MKYHHEQVMSIKNPVKIKFLGGAKEVGRSALLVVGGRTSLLLDYGVMIGREPGFPVHISPRNVNAIVLTHAHLDHSGAIPLFHVTSNIPVYGTKPTFELTELLITDFIHLSGYYLPFEFIDLQTMVRQSISIGYNQPTKIRGMTVNLLNSGHIPGSAQAIIERRGKRILYTSDFNPRDTQLLRGADQSFEDIDVLIMESTYADEDHQDREREEQRFMDNVNQIVEGDGTVLIPAFSVGRSQEILCILAAHDFDYPVAIDGMAKAATDIIKQHPSFLRDQDLFMKAYSMMSKIGGWRERRRAARRPGVIISPAGMLKGGNAVFYMNTIAKKSKNAVFLVSYQIPDSPGRRLMETKRFIIGGKTRKVKATIDHFDFTSHGGRSHLLETVKRVKSTGQIFLVHGAEENCQELATLIREELGYNAVAPETDETYTV